jgi:hypothetical protein
MKNIVKKLLSTSLLLSIFAPIAYTNPQESDWATTLHKNPIFYRAQHRHIFKKKSYLHESFQGCNDLDKEKFNIIMQSDTWNIVLNKIKINEKCTKTNRDWFKKFLNQHGFSQETINFLAYPLKNNHVFLILKSMWLLGYSFKEIDQFKHFLIGLFAPFLYKDIKLFEKSIKERAKQEVYNYLIKGFRPDWVISLDDDDLCTSLMIAVNSNDYDLVAMLIECPETDLNATNSQGMNALMMSIKNKNEQIARLLLKKKEWDFWNFNTNRETAIALASIHLPALENIIAQQFKPYLMFQ